MQHNAPRRRATSTTTAAAAAALLLLLLLLPATTTAFLTSALQTGGRPALLRASPTPTAAPAAAAASTEAAAALLAQATTTRKVPSPEVFAAMEALEASTKPAGKKQGSAAPTNGGGFQFPSFFGAAPAVKPAASKAKVKTVSLGDVAAAGEGGQWEIVYSSILKSGYMPGAICEIVSIENSGSSGAGIRIDNTAGGIVPLGSVVGDYAWDAAAGRMTFGFDKFELGPLKMGMGRKEKSYDFFWVDAAIACARSSAGGLTLMRRVAKG